MMQWEPMICPTCQTYLKYIRVANIMGKSSLQEARQSDSYYYCILGPKGPTLPHCSGLLHCSGMAQPCHRIYCRTIVRKRDCFAPIQTAYSTHFLSGSTAAERTKWLGCFWHGKTSLNISCCRWQTCTARPSARRRGRTNWVRGRWTVLNVSNIWNSLV